MKFGKMRLVVAAIVVALTLGSVQTAFASSTVHYTFSENVPPTGFVHSSVKNVNAGVVFKTDLQACYASDGSSQGTKGVYFRAYNNSNNGVIQNTSGVKAGSGVHTLINSVTYTRDVYIGLQAMGTSYVTAAGYWYY
jgi:hypothetical protein